VSFLSRLTFLFFTLILTLDHIQVRRKQVIFSPTIFFLLVYIMSLHFTWGRQFYVRSTKTIRKAGKGFGIKKKNKEEKFATYILGSRGCIITCSEILFPPSVLLLYFYFVLPTIHPMLSTNGFPHSPLPCFSFYFLSLHERGNDR